MSVFKNKYFLPLCLAGLIGGYGAAELILPHYFHPNDSTRIQAEDLIAALGKQPDYYRQTSSGNYLAGQYAQNHKDWDKANDFIGRVLTKDSDNPELQKHAMVVAMASGHVNSAIEVAKEALKNTTEGREGEDLLAILFAALDNFKNENYLGAINTLDQTSGQDIAGFIVPILKMWAQTAQGILDTDTLEKNPFYAYHALMAGHYLNQPQAVIEYATNAFNIRGVDVRDLEESGDLFAKSGAPEKAKEIYQTIIDSGFTSPKIVEKLDGLSQQKDISGLITLPTVKSPKDGAALIFLGMSEIFFREYGDDSSTIFAQMAYHLNPDLEAAMMIIGNILIRHKKHMDAISYFQKIEESSDLYPAAQRQIANLYAEQNQDDKAIKILRELYNQNDDINALIQIGDIYRYQEEYKSAVKIYNQVIALWDEVPEKYWSVLYSRGMMYERLKEFKKSEIDLQAALAFRPNHPYILNYLGYSWADQGINLEQSLDMITRAALARPQDGYIADSLGWVYYKMNDFEAAIPHLEQAVELRPYDATINDHLGDAYWQVGRKTEAKFQWRRASNYSEENEAELKEKIDQKLISGLDEGDV